MSLLPKRYPQRDFFVLDIADVVLKDDMGSMEHPLFSLATKPDMRHLEYRGGGNRLKIVPSGVGLPTIFDKDILIFCISQLMHKKNRGEDIGKRVRFNARELLMATNRPTNNLGYQRLEQAFHRLRGTNFQTDITTGGKRETKVFGLIDEGGFVMKEVGNSLSLAKPCRSRNDRRASRETTRHRKINGLQTDQGNRANVAGSPYGVILPPAGTDP
jgi:plasmid replication initiation protein